MLLICHPSLKHEIQDIALKIGSFGSFVLEGLRSKVAFRQVGERYVKKMRVRYEPSREQKWRLSWSTVCDFFGHKVAH